MGCLIAFRLCRSRVLALAAVLLLFFVGQGWSACSRYTDFNHNYGYYRMYYGDVNASIVGSCCTIACSGSDCLSSYNCVQRYGKPNCRLSSSAPSNMRILGVVDNLSYCATTSGDRAFKCEILSCDNKRQTDR